MSENKLKDGGIISDKTAAIIGTDTVILRNQPISREGVLEYQDGNKLKKWEDLARNDGRIIPIVDEHPNPDNGFEGLISGREKIWGAAHVKTCPNGKNAMCADIYLLDNAPVKNGYSVGYPYESVEEEGTFDGKTYSEIQSGLLFDHLALTDSPRDARALQILGDSRLRVQEGRVTRIAADSSDGKPGILINRVAHDSCRFTFDSTERFKSIKNKLKSFNPSMNDTELNARSIVMYANESELNRMNTMSPINKDQEPVKPEDKKEEMDEDPKKDESMDKCKDSLEISTKSIDSTITRDALIADNSKLRAEKDAMVIINKKIRAIEAELKSERDAKEKFKNLYEKQLTTEVRTMIDSLVNDHGFKVDAFKDQSRDFVAGTLFGVRAVSNGQCSNETDSLETGEDGTELDDINNYRYNHKTGAMESIKKKGGK